MGEEVPCVSDSPLNVHAQYILPHNAAVPPDAGGTSNDDDDPLLNDPIHAICHAVDAIAAKNSQDLAQRPSIGLIQRHQRQPRHDNDDKLASSGAPDVAICEDPSFVVLVCN
ncbi:hypothetical protein V498_06561 [Pseudogymnoascus sp. VKM F-4517 (FW-2822)]|nr:hypothetical protein V498_06561 [Pseudogymnoascus sp. VKM F-4517 (FW-2822)]